MKEKKENALVGFKMILELTSKKEKFKLIGFVFLNILNGLLDLVPALAISIIANMLMGIPAVFLWFVIPADFSVWSIMAIGFTLNILRQVISNLSNSSLRVFGSMLRLRMQEESFDWVLIPRKNMDINITSGDASHRIKEAAHATEDIFIYVFEMTMPMLFSSLFAFAYLITIDITAIPIVFLAAIIIGFMVKWRSKRAKEVAIKLEKSSSRISNNIINVLSNLLVVNLFRTEKYESKLMKKIDNEKFLNVKNGFKIRTIYWVIIDSIEVLTVFSLIAITVSKSMTGLVDVGNIILISNYSYRIFNPITQMGWIFSEMYLRSIKIMRVRELKPEIEKTIDTSKDVNISESFESIEMVSVKVKNSENSVISDINMKFLKGEISVISGKSGKGKTTAIRALTGLAERECGDIIINEKYKIHTMQSYIDRFSVTMQSPYIFNRDVSENIFYPNNICNEVSEELFENLYMKNLANRTYDVDSEQNLENQLSGGEKKKICVSRGILKKSEVYIFDEPTNELDNDNTQKIINELNKLKNNAIVIIVTHDARVVSIADKVIKM